MQPGDIALSLNPDAWYATIITWVTRGRYSHVRLVIDRSGKTIEAFRGGVKYGKVRPTDVVVQAPLSREQRAKVRETAEQFLDTPYGWIDVVVLGLGQLHIKLPYLNKRMDRWDRLFCSQLVDVVWRLLQFYAFDDRRQSQNVSPADLNDLAFRNGWPIVQKPLQLRTSSLGPGLESPHQ